jgi:hypothetical protein
VVGALSAILLATACVDTEPELGDVSAELASLNGLPTINGLNTQNGLGTQNGLSTQNGLNTQNGLVDGGPLMSTPEGRTTVAYLVACALPAGRWVTKLDQYGQSYTFAGGIGVAPKWETGACDSACQRWISACMVAHINTAGVHVPIWLVADKKQQPQIGWGLSEWFPHQEGSFFGNIFISPPRMYYCNGRDYDVSTVPGRIGYDTSVRPYVNPWGYDALCDSKCGKANTAGYADCYGYKQVITVWRP